MQNMGRARTSGLTGRPYFCLFCLHRREDGEQVYVTKGETFKRQRGHEDPCPAAFITFSTIHESKYELCLCAMKKMGPNVSLVPQQLLQKRLPSMVLISNSQESFLFCSA